MSTARNIVDWSARHGLRTPVSLLATAAPVDAARRLRAELPGCGISYATKANAMPQLLSCLAGEVDEFNVTNVAHLDGLLAAGVPAHRIQFLHPVISADTARAVLDRGVRRFVVDDHRGLELLTGFGQRLELTVRVRPPDPGESATSVVRFGAPCQEADTLVKAVLDSGSRLAALSFFVGTAGMGMAHAQPFRHGIEMLADVVDNLARNGIGVPAVNIGGGFPGARRMFHREHPDFFCRIAQHLDRCLGTGFPVICEPGRYLAEPSMLLLTSVLADRALSDRRLVYLDGSGFAGLFETSFVDPSSGPELQVVDAESKRSAATATVLGPVMDSYDVIARNVALPATSAGEPVVVPNVGAYTWGYSTSTEGVRQPEVVALPAELDAAVAAAWHA